MKPVIFSCAARTAAILVLLLACRATAADIDPFERTRLLREAGRALFTDVRLSRSERLSCASCHAPSRRYNPPDARDVQPGGVALDAFSFRAPPTLTYLAGIPAYSNHFHDSDEEGDESIDNGPTGGLTWDGRIDGGANQAALPLLAANEMANTRAGVASVARRAPYAKLLGTALGERVLDDDAQAFGAVVRALGAFEEDYDEFSPYTSKYDAYLTGRAKLSTAQARGLALFNAPEKGNCAQCHRSERTRDGAPPAFSDYGLIALGVPRNAAIVRNRDPQFHDLGACGPLRTDKAQDASFCGLFRTPSLRNVALRRTFFHNGKFHDLRDVVAFYVTRDITPQRWYPRELDGSVRVYDDLPPAYQANLNRDPPFAGQRPGATPRLDAREIDDVVAFLQTLNDGYLRFNPYRAERIGQPTAGNAVRAAAAPAKAAR
jgi:cytochrome c peroxidase